MVVLAALLLFLCLAMLGYYVHRDLAEYARFKLLTETADRQLRYLQWVRKSFLLFTGTSIVCVAVLGRLHSLMQLPPEFGALSQQLQARMPRSQISDGFLIGFAGILLVGLIAGVVLGSVLAGRGKNKSQPFVLGDIEALLPRNGPETACTTLLSLNAGLGEELFFRLLLPLLLTLVTGKAIVAFAVAAVVFGLAHIYQKTVGVVATTIVGVVFTAIYLWTGSLWIAVCLHAGLDLVGLVIRPTVTRVVTARLGR
jgi:uncharacterized protein